MRLPPGWELPDGIRRRLGASAGRQRAMIADGHLLLVLHTVPEAGGDNAREGRYFWRSAEGVWHGHERGDGKAQLRAHIQSYLDAASHLETEFRGCAEAATYFRLLEILGPLKRASAHMHETLQIARQDLPDFAELIDLRDLAYEAARAAELLYEDVRNALDCALMRRAEEENRINKRLALAGHRINLIATIFLPLTALTGLFSMNVHSGMVEHLGVLGWWVVLICGIFLGFALRAAMSMTGGEDEC